MNGSQKQIAWANDILAPVLKRIESLPPDKRKKALNSYNRIESAKTVIDCQNNIHEWCEKFDAWNETGIWPGFFGPVAADEPPVIRSVII